MVKTAKVEDRRKLRFETVVALLLDVDKIVAADKAGKLRRSGNWTAGQAFGHLATWINYAYEGFPMRVPWIIRVLIRMKKNSYLRSGMQAGVHIPKVPNGTYGTELLGTEEGAERLRKALGRLKSNERAKFDSPAFGPMGDQERLALNLRHAELHLSFLHP